MNYIKNFSRTLCYLALTAYSHRFINTVYTRTHN